MNVFGSLIFSIHYWCSNNWSEEKLLIDLSLRHPALHVTCFSLFLTMVIRKGIIGCTNDNDKLCTRMIWVTLLPLIFLAWQQWQTPCSSPCQIWIQSHSNSCLYNVWTPNKGQGCSLLNWAMIVQIDYLSNYYELYHVLLISLWHVCGICFLGSVHPKLDIGLWLWILASIVSPQCMSSK